ncbi:MAG: hypothetical protein ABSG95_02805 [Solirubrobacteraceae bacterium]|jgi:hypothetical protein
MAGKPAEPPPPGRSEIDPRGEGDEHARRGEHAGPLKVVRHVKDDGRALILYTRAENPR